LKTLFRSPIKTIVTFLLIAAASFALLSRVTDYAITSREMNRVISHYRLVVAIDNGIPDTSEGYNKSALPGGYIDERGFYGNQADVPVALTTEMIETLSTLPGVTLAEIRYKTGGILCDYERFYRYEDLNFGFNYTAKYIIEGTLARVNIIRDKNWVHELGIEPGNGHFDLTFVDTKVLAGKYPLDEIQNVFFKTSRKISDHTIYYGPLPYDFAGENIFRVNGWTTDLAGSLSLPYARLDPDMVSCPHVKPNVYNLDFFSNLEIGERYILIGTYSELFPIVTRLGQCETHDYFPYAKVSDLETNPGLYAKLKNLIEITAKDFHTFDIVYTTDMRVIPRVNEEMMVLLEGRFLTPEDDKNNARVCVVSNIFFEKNNLKLGDKLTIELGDKLFKQHAGMGAITYIPERAWNTIKTVEFEIVGVYMDNASPYSRAAQLYFTYHPATIFVPKSHLPVEVPAQHEVWAGEFSVLVENPHDIEAFWEAAPVYLEAKYRSSDLSWVRVKGVIEASTMASLVTVLSFAAGSLLALVLAVYLYIGRSKLSYAILRALGTTHKQVCHSFGLPFAVLSCFAVLTGGIFGTIYTSRAITPMLHELETNVVRYTADITLPVDVIILCLLGMLGFIMLLTLLFLNWMGKTPLLELLQGNLSKPQETKRDDKPPHRDARKIVPISEFRLGKINISEAPVANVYPAFRHITRYILRHVLRVKWKTAITLTLTIVLIGAMGFLTLIRLFYIDLVDDLIITATTKNFSTSAINELHESELTENLYYISDHPIFYGKRKDTTYPLLLTNDFFRSLENFGENYQLRYAEGFSDDNIAEFFKGDNPANLCIVGDYFGTEPGDIITLKAGYYDVFEKGTINLTVAAVIEPTDPFDTRDVFNVFKMTFTPLNDNIKVMQDNIPFTIKYSEFTLTDNDRITDFTILLEDLRAESQLITVTAEFNTELSELENIKRVRDLLVLLFPIAACGAVLIGVTASGLLFLQSAKEAAILRILGTTKKQVHLILLFEQVGLCLVGVILAAGGLMLYNLELLVKSAGTIAVCLMLYLFGYICAGLVVSVTITKRKVLDLLHVKE